MKDITFFFILLQFFSPIFACSKNDPETPYFVSDNYVIIKGKIVAVFSPDCDTTYDTIPLDLILDTVNSSENQIRINKFKMKMHYHLLKVSIPLNDSLMLIRKIKCEPSQLIIEPVDNLNLPSAIDTVIISLFDLGSDCSADPVRLLDDRVVGSVVVSGGCYYPLKNNPNKVYMPYYAFSGHLNFYWDVSELNCDLHNLVYFKLSEAGKEVKFSFELAKQLLFLINETSLKNQVAIANNLMYHPYYLNDPSAFRMMVFKNLKNLSADSKKNIAKKQEAIALKKH